MASHCFCNTLGLLDTFINQSQFSALSSTHRPRQVYTASHNRSDTCLYSGGCCCWYKTSGVTMGWLLRLVTGGPHWQGGPRQLKSS